ncbi:MAG: 50S ribosomal protein L4 [bacterium]
MKKTVYNQEGEKIKEVDLPSEIFDVVLNKDLVHQAVVTQMANSRKVIAHTKDRGETRGGGKKPWRQKGTGRARHGSIRSPIWRGGGITFGPTKERVFSKKINKKMKQKALFMALTTKAKDKELILLDNLELGQAKTKQMALIMNNLETKIKKDLRKGTLIASSESDQKILRAIRNIPEFKIVRADSLNIVDILSYKFLIILEQSIGVIKKTYKL